MNSIFDQVMRYKMKADQGFLVWIIGFSLVFIQCKKDKENETPTQTNNNKIKRIFVNGSDPQKYEFEYSGNVLSRVTAYGIGDYAITDQLTCEYEFGSNGKLKMQRSNFDGTTYQSNYFYNSDGKLSKVEILGDEDEPDLNQYYYNDDGSNTLCTYSFYNSDGKYHLADSIVYSSYNSFGKPELKIDYYYSYSNGVPVLSSSKERYSYDAQGNLIKEEYYNNLNSEWVVQSEYEFDINKQVSYPEEFMLFFRFMDESETDIFDPAYLLTNRIPTKTKNYTDCNSVRTSYEFNHSIELNSNGMIIREAGTDEHVEEDCSKSSSDVEILFNYYE